MNASIVEQTGLLKSYTDGGIELLAHGTYDHRVEVTFNDGARVRIDPESWFDFRMEALKAFRETDLPQHLFYSDRVSVMLLRRWLLLQRNRLSDEALEGKNV